MRKRHDEPSSPFDPEFTAALRHLIEERGWTITEFCDRTRLAPDAERRINPPSVSDWMKRSSPSNRALLIVCETLGVRRSHFFEVGERLVRVKRELAQSERLLDTLDSLELALRRRLDRLAALEAAEQAAGEDGRDPEPL